MLEIDLLRYGFMHRAFIAGIFIAIITSFLGTYLVLRQLSLIGDGLAHASFAGVAVGFLFNMNPVYAMIAVAVAASLGIRRLVAKTRVYGDAAIALTYAAGMAVAVTIIGYARGFNANLFSYLFGSILSLGVQDLALIGGVTVIVVGFVVYFYDTLLLMGFNEDLARLQGTDIDIINQVMMVLVALSVVVGVRAVGILLVTALIVIPPMTALQLSDSFREAMAVGVGSSVTAMIAGITIAFYADLPPSGTIVLTMLGMFLLAAGLNRLTG